MNTELLAAFVAAATTNFNGTVQIANKFINKGLTTGTLMVRLEVNNETFTSIEVTKFKEVSDKNYTGVITDGRTTATINITVAANYNKTFTAELVNATPAENNNETVPAPGTELTEDTDPKSEPLAEVG